MDREVPVTAVDALIGEGLLDPGDRQHGIAVLRRVLTEPVGPSGAPVPVRTTPPLVEVVAYLGGALVLAAGALFVAQEWEALGLGGQVTLLVVVTAVLAGAGAVSARVPGGRRALCEPAQDTRRRLAGALYTAAGLTTAFLVGLVAEELIVAEEATTSGSVWPAVLGAAAGTLVASVGYRLAPGAVGVVGMLVGVLTVTGNLVGDLDVPGSEGDASGVAFFLVGLTWLVLTEVGAFRERTLAQALGVAVLLFGAQVPAIDGTHAWLGYLLTLLVAGGTLTAYLRTSAWPYLAGAVLAVTLVVPEVVLDWTGGSLGAVGGVLVAGVTLLLASYGGYRLRSQTRD